VSADIKGRIRVWSLDPAAEVPTHAFDGPAGLLLLGFSASGSELVTGHRIGTTYLRSLDHPSFVPPLELLQGHRGAITEAAFHPNGRWMALGQQVPTQVVWPLGRTYPRVLLREEGAGNDGYKGFAFSPDGTWIAAKPHYERPLRRIPLTRSAGEDVVTVTDEVGERARGVHFDPAGRYLFVGSDKSVYFLPLPGGRPRELPAFESGAGATAVSRDGQLVAAGGGDGNDADQFVRVWDTESWEHRDLRVGKPVSDIKFTGDDRMIFAAGGDLHRWNLTDPDPELLAEGVVGSNSYTGRIDVSPDGRYVLIARDPGEGGSWRYTHGGVLDLETGETRWLETHLRGPHRVFDPTGKIVVSASGFSVSVGRVSGEEPHALLGHESWVTQVAVSPDGNWIASSGADGTLRLWPMPDLDRPPLHALPHEELLEVLRSQTNLRMVPNPESPGDYQLSIENPGFHSWDDVPTW
jgi:WD40 repeat protein